MARASREGGEQLAERTERREKAPDQHQVVLLNDDYTTMEFVMEVLESIFHKSPAEAYRIMLMVHTKGRGICGVYTWEVAETKAASVVDMAQQSGFPLRAVVEEA